MNADNTKAPPGFKLSHGGRRARAGRPAGPARVRATFRLAPHTVSDLRRQARARGRSMADHMAGLCILEAAAVQGVLK